MAITRFFSWSGTVISQQAWLAKFMHNVAHGSHYLLTHGQMADSTQVIYRGWFNIKMPSYQYRKSHCGDKTIFRPSYLHNGISYTGKTTSLYWIRALVPSHFTSELIEDSCHSWIDGLLYIGQLYGDYTIFFVVGHCYFTTGLTCEIRVWCRTRLSLLAFSLPSKGITISSVNNFIQLWGIRQVSGQMWT